MRVNVGRKTSVVSCRRTMSLKTGGGLAQSGTFSEADSPEIVVVAMSPHRRHVTKPICQITYGIREAGFDVNVLVLNRGQGIPPDSPFIGSPSGGVCEINLEEIEKINRHKLAILHLGSVKDHVLYKARYFLRLIKIPVIIVCQAPITLEELSKMDEEAKLSGGKVVGLVTGVVRGLDVDEGKLNEIVENIRKNLPKP
ncbi:MAG: methyl-coenzyme M reductase I operon protein C [Candidatus Bathyarchaeota archaeon]